MAWERHGMYELAFNTTGERHGMCESAFVLISFPSYRPLMHFVHRNGKMSNGMLTLLHTSLHFWFAFLIGWFAC
jgi:hypothetical protein